MKRSILLATIPAFLLAWPFIWTNGVLEVSRLWTAVVLLAALLAAVPEDLWQRLPALSGRIWPLLLNGLLLAAALLLSWPATINHNYLAIFLALTLLLLTALGLILRRPGAAANLALAGFGLLFALLLANIGAGFMLTALEQASALPTPPVEEVAPTAAEVTEAAESPTPAPTNTPAPPTATPDPALPAPTPEPTRPVAGFGYLEWLEDNGEAEWTYHTAYGPRVNSRAHAYMVDGQGNTIYDTIVNYNSKGLRGPEVSYEKEEDVFRILVIGDSFVEAIQVDYEETFPVLLQQALDEHNTAGRRYEVVAMGRTGWGTVHETVYYQVEGYKYDADLVLLMFFINDVADNFPTFFYPNINNTNYEFLFEEETVRIVDTNEQALPPNRGRQLYNALPGWLKNRSLARLFVRLADPPQPIMTPGGVMTRVHPQFYIYVSQPEVEGYPEAWQRTDQALDLLAASVEENGAELVVAPIFIGTEMIQNVSNWFPELTDGWQWDPALPETELQSALSDSGARLLPLRSYYESYADSAGGEVYNLMYLPEDGHFNETGHQVTAEAVYTWLLEQGLVGK